ncbi:MAG: putative RNA binding protein YcfA, dsRBD-like fold, HicA-like mRNA interferase family [Candidatus Methanocomedens sp.]|nr:MAG: putative RNA binding protein YcfA, dsRBD-like fold, HicA-like mRNA interferase family [ANME-2 cluster archaeon]
MHETIKALNSIGFQVVSQKGSHIELKRKNDNETFTVIIPNYNEIPIGTLKSIIRQAGLSPEDFIKLF